MAENTTAKEVEDSQHLFNIHSTVIQHPSNVGLTKNVPSEDEVKDTDPPKYIQHTAREEGERGCVEQEQFDGVLQNTLVEENKSVEVQTKRLTNRLNEQNPFQVDDFILDVLTESLQHS